jgi:hypothetical protein
MKESVADYFALRKIDLGCRDGAAAQRSKTEKGRSPEGKMIYFLHAAPIAHPRPRHLVPARPDIVGIPAFPDSHPPTAAIPATVQVASEDGEVAHKAYGAGDRNTEYRDEHRESSNHRDSYNSFQNRSFFSHRRPPFRGLRIP